MSVGAAWVARWRPSVWDHLAQKSPLRRLGSPRLRPLNLQRTHTKSTGRDPSIQGLTPPGDSGRTLKRGPVAARMPSRVVSRTAARKLRAKGSRAGQGFLLFTESCRGCRTSG